MGANPTQHAQQMSARALRTRPPAGAPLRILVTALTAFALAGITISCRPGASGRIASPEERSFTDELGREIKVKLHPTRIVSLAPSVTETLFALELGSEIVGVTTYCDYPAAALEKEKVGDTLRPSLEKIVALKPDLAIASTSSQLEYFVKRLDELGVPIYVSSPRDVEAVLASIERIGEIAGVPERARSLAGELGARVEAVGRAVGNRGRPRVFFMLGSEPLITAGRSSFINDLIERAGGESISADEASDYPQFSLETAVARKPEVIFLQSGEQRLPARLRLTPAAREGRVFQLSDELLLRPGPRIVEGLERMAQKIHPEAFRGAGSALPGERGIGSSACPPPRARRDALAREATASAGGRIVL